uniref:CAZy families GT4 protein n=1 Tax=uncultured Lactobacillus sp. TaxID=153152 RepID=A0A060CL31_9LACO|nr:CAZy families GT4 protein [uncultured Lactobacillus sp.]
MKIIIYTLGLLPYRRGGLVRYSTDLARELAKTNDVTVLFPGKMSLNKYTKKLSYKKRKTKESFKLYEIINPLPVSLNFGVRNDKFFCRSRNEVPIEDFLS